MSLGPLQDEFRKHTQEAVQMAAFRQHAVDMGMKGDALVAGVIDNSAAATKEAQGSIAEMAEKQAKQQADDALFLAVLNDLERDLADVRERRQAYEEELVDEYGEDFIVDMAERFLDPEVVERLPNESEAEYRNRLEDKLEDLMLNDDGSIKAGYEDYTIALWLREKGQEERLELKRDNLIEEYQTRIDAGEEPDIAAHNTIKGQEASAVGAALSLADNAKLEEAAGSEFKAVEQGGSLDGVAAFTARLPT